MRDFELFEPKTVEEACHLLAQFKGEARPLAGGTDLVVELKGGWLAPAALVNLKKIEGLHKIVFNPRDGLRIGASVTWTQLLEFDPIALHYDVLRQAAETMGSMQVRNMATLAGNICHASPAANGAIPLLLYEAECRVQGPEGVRLLPVEKIFDGVQKNTLQNGEVLAEIRVPMPPAGAKGTFYKFAPRKAMDLALVGVGVLIRERKGLFDEVRIALGAVAPQPFRARQAERTLLGKGVDDQIIREAAEEASLECSPVTDIRASREYRMDLIKELTYRAIKESLAQ
jgi:CO/xanthine dehydrogenase FAD-binding subunit